MTKRNTATLIVALLALVATVWFLFIRPENALREAARAHAEATMAETQTEAAKGAITITVDHHNEVDRITTRTVESSHEILTAPGADAGLDPELHAAGLRALCLQDGRRDPQCADVLHRDGGGERAED